MQRVAEIIEGDPAPRKAVVLSACRGVTDALLNLVMLAEQQDAALDDRIEALRQRHIGIARELLAGDLYDEFLVELDRDCHDIAGILQTVRLVRAASTTLRDLIAGYGELWSTRLFERLLRRRGRSQGRVQWLDARRVLLVEWGPLGPGVRWEQSRANLQAAVPPDFTGTVVITGFIATDSQGLQTTLGRNGSDFSASIFGSLFDAGEIVIWTDVDGVLSADPRLVPEAQVIDALSYNEAMELAYFGAKVIHPQTMAPAVQKRIPIWIKNTFAPDAPGTLIHDRTAPSPLVKGITTVERIALVNLEGAGMIGVPGTAHRLFGALREEGISVILISQGSSEHSICFAVPEPEADRAERVVRRAFEPELREGQIQSVEVNRSCSILAVVGDGMAGAHGVAAQVFAALAKASVNVRAIAQGASERNISVVIDARGSARALRAVHSSFYLSAHTVSIGLIGPGLVGGALLDQVASQVERLRRDFKLDLRVRGIAGSKSMRLTQGSIDLARWRDEYAVGGDPVDLERFADHVHADQFPHAVIIDCSASAAVASRYAHWLSQGILRGDRRRGPAGDPDAARPARDRRRDPAHRGHLLGHARLPVQHLGRPRVVFVGGEAGEDARLHRARSARRPVGHGRRPQADHPGARDGPQARARRRAGREPRAGRARRLWRRGLPRAPARVRCANAGATRGGTSPWPRAALRRFGRCRRARPGGCRRTADLAPVREHRAHRQHRALPDRAL